MKSQASKPLRLLLLALLVLTGCVSPRAGAPAAAPTPAERVEVVELQPIVYTLPLAPGAIPAPVAPAQQLAPNAIPPPSGHHVGAFVTQAFPIGSASGDLVGTFPSPGVSQCGGQTTTCTVLAATLQFGQSVATPLIDQLTTSSASGQTLSIVAQNSSATTGTGGNLVLSPGTGTSTNQTPGFVTVSIPALAGTGTAGQFQVTNATHNVFVADTQGVVLGRTDASQLGMRVAPLIGQETSFSAMWIGAQALAPTSSNYKFAFQNNAASDFWSFGVANLGVNNLLTINGSNGQLTWASIATATPLIMSNTTGATAVNFGITASGSTQGSGTTTGGSIVLTAGTVAAGSNGTPGSVQVALGAPQGTGSHAYLNVLENATSYALLGKDTTVSRGALFLGPSMVPSSSNYVLRGDGTNVEINAALGTGGAFFSMGGTSVGLINSSGWQLFSATPSFGGGTGVLGMANVTTAPTANPTGGLVAWTAVSGNSKLALLGTTGQEVDIGLGAAPSFTQASQASTSGGSGAVGNTMTVLAQGGQPATGASNNGGNGGQVTVSGGAGGTSGSATAGVAGPVVLANGLVTTMTVGPTATSGGPASIGLANTSVSITASSNTTFTLTATQYQNPMIVLTGTLTSAAVATVALPNVTAMWWFDDSAVVFTSGSINWKCGGGTASASISSLVTTSELIMVSCRGTTVSLHTENDAGPLPSWRYAANDNALDPCDVRRRAA